jgi:hypothetical protein
MGKTGSSKDASPIRFQSFERNAKMCDPQFHVMFMDNFFTPYDFLEDS